MTYPCTVRHIKTLIWVWGVLFRGFCFKKISMNGIIGHFLSSNTTYEYELLWNSENVTNVTKVLNVRENWKWKTYLNLIEKFDSVGKMMLYGICEGRLNPWIFEWKFNRNSLLLCLFTVWLEQGAALITNCLVVHFLLQ